MSLPRCTPGVERIFTRAREMARGVDTDEILPAHVLVALAMESGQGSEILEGVGVSVSDLTEYFALADDVTPSDEVPSGESEPAIFSAEVSQILRHAERLAARRGRYSELGSEHVLLAILQTDPAIAGFLWEKGLSLENLRERIDLGDDQPDQPIPIDFALAENETAATDETDIYRILDAAANRVREGVRVIEDVARFSRDDPFLSELLKSWRHDLRTAFKLVDGDRLLSARDTGADVGTAINTPGEQRRQSMTDVVRANCKRVQEGMRTLEEFGKILSPQLGGQLGQLRYRFYTIEKVLHGGQSIAERFAGRHLYWLLTTDQTALDWKLQLDIALKSGVDVVQLREKNRSDREILQIGQHIREATRETGALFIMNDRPDLAAILEADGVHVGQEELTVRQCRRILGPGKLVGVSTHSREQARQAVMDGADYLGVGPVFPSGTKSFEEFAGLDYVREVASEIALPWFAIGGITQGNLSEVQSAGATRIAVSGAISRTNAPGDVIRQLRERLVTDCPTD